MNNSRKYAPKLVKENTKTLLMLVSKAILDLITYSLLNMSLLRENLWSSYIRRGDKNLSQPSVRRKL